MAAVTGIGIDGSRGQWVAALVTVDQVRFDVVALNDIERFVGDESATVAIDIPIGLPDSGRRDCDAAARRLLRGRRSTIFDAPPRSVLAAASYADARRILDAGPSMSAQAFGLVNAVRAVDDVISPADEHRVVECHPELSFLAMAGDPLASLGSKKLARGQAERRALIASWRPDALDAAHRLDLPTDDVYDALACAWTAERFALGRCRQIPESASRRDSRGLLMRIVT